VISSKQLEAQSDEIRNKVASLSEFLDGFLAIEGAM
jgi:hypothetical protein